MVDFCARAGSPPNELYQLMYKNLAEIIWYGAQGFLIDPIVEHKFGVEVLIHSSWADGNWQAVEIPKKFRENIKFRNACYMNGKYYCVPQSVGLPEIGAIVAEGDSMEETIDKIKEIAEAVKGYYLEVKVESIDKALDEFKKLEEFGVKII
jgi:predicted RNase H-like HicB family nuclease